MYVSQRILKRGGPAPEDPSPALRAWPEGQKDHPAKPGCEGISGLLMEPWGVREPPGPQELSQHCLEGRMRRRFWEVACGAGPSLRWLIKH